MERRYNLFEALESYHKMMAQEQDSSIELSIVKARLFPLYLEIEGTMRRHLKEAELKEFMNNMSANDYDTLLKAIYTISDVLDRVKLTRLDTRVPYDSTRVIVEDKAKGH